MSNWSHATCNQKRETRSCHRMGTAIDIKGKKFVFLNDAEKRDKTHLVLRDAASTYITAYNQVISTKKVMAKITPIKFIWLKRFGISKL